MKHIAVAMLAVVPLHSASAAAGSSPEARNVLLIMIDDMNDWVGVLGGNEQARTPNIDELASQGMLFSNAHTVSPACLPSRTALLTGVSPFVSGVYDQSGDWRDVAALQEVPTLPEYFRESGYASYGAGKIFHAHTFSSGGLPGQQDADSWDGFYPSFERQLPDEVRPLDAPLNGNPLLVEEGEDGTTTVRWLHTGFDWSGMVVEDFAMGDGQVVKWVEKQLQADSDVPTFLAAGIYRPHLPWYVPQEYFDLYPLESIQLPTVNLADLKDIPDSAPFQGSRGTEMGPTDQHEWVQENDLWREAVQGYLASISFADAMVGRIVSALKNSGKAENTIVVLVSDHGYHLGEKQRWRKMTLWEESTRVPLIVVAPGLTTPGSTSAEAVSLLDVYPTLVDLAGLAMPDHLDGESLLPLLSEPGASRDTPAITVWGYGNYAVRDDRYRYIRYEDGSEELYDHEADPDEWFNLAEDEDRSGIKRALAGYIPSNPAPSYTADLVEAD